MKRVAFFRPAEYADETIRMFQENGLHVLHAPLLMIKEFPEKIGELERRLEDTGVDFLIFTSRTSVRIVMKHIDLNRLKMHEIIAIGPVTAGELRNFGITPLVPGKYTSADIVEEFEEILEGKNVVVVRSDKGDPAIYRLGNVCKLEEIAIYTLVPARGKAQEDLLRRISSGEVDVVVFSSSMMVDSFFDLAVELGLYEDIKGALQKISLVAIGPPTERKLKKFGLNPAVPSEHTFRGILKLINTS